MEIKETVGHLRAIMNRVQRQSSTLDPDLPAEIRKRRVADLWSKDLDGKDPSDGTRSMKDLATELVNDLRQAKDQFSKQRASASDPGMSVVVSALQKSGEVNLGDAMLSNSLNALSADELAYLASMTNKAGVLLAVKDEALRRQFEPDEKTQVWDSINSRESAFIDQGAVVFNAKNELAALTAIHDYESMVGSLGNNPTERLSLAREMESLKELVGE